MLDSQILLSGKRKYLFSLLLLLFISGFCVAFSVTSGDDFDLARREVLLRKIGHELLLQSGDSTSRVLPVEKTAENEYQISFEHDLTFQPDSLVNTTGRLLSKDPLAGDYIVNVRNCSSPAVMFGYAISRNEKDNIVACSGRVQPRACYVISIKFKPKVMNIVGKGYLFGGLPFLAFVGFIFYRSVKPRRVVPGDQNNGMLTLSSVLFNTNRRQLTINGNTIELTGTETRILQILALSPNETINRSRLQKEIWEDEGVIVGRSLDMFISKLRKKLEADPTVNIVNVRGKGYKLDIGT